MQLWSVCHQKCYLYAHSKAITGGQNYEIILAIIAHRLFYNYTHHDYGYLNNDKK